MIRVPANHLIKNVDIGHFAPAHRDEETLVFDEAPLDAPPPNITVAWVGKGPDPSYNGYSERDGKIIHYLEVFPGIVAAGTIDELRDKLGLAGLALAHGEQELLRDMAQEGRRRAQLEHRGLA